MIRRSGVEKSVDLGSQAFLTKLCRVIVYDGGLL